MKKIITDWMGSKFTLGLIQNEIRSRWGEKEANLCDLQKNCFSLKKWNDMGYRVIKGEKAIQSFVVEVEYDESGEQVSSNPKRINVFYKFQVEKV